MTDTDCINTLKQLLTTPGAPVDAEWVEAMHRLCPTFYIAPALLLKRNPKSVDDALRSQLQRSLSLNCPDRTALADYIDPNDSGWSDFYPPESQQEADTSKTIDIFIDHYGQPSTPEEDALLERLLFNPAPADYFAGTDTPYNPADPLELPPELRKEEKEEKEEEKAAPAPQAEKTAKEPKKAPSPTGEEPLLMESLAKIFIKQRRYERALEIISKLSLNYPEKSVYFADQMRFLQKLIINQEYSNRENIKQQQ